VVPAADRSRPRLFEHPAVSGTLAERVPAGHLLLSNHSKMMSNETFWPYSADSPSVINLQAIHLHSDSADPTAGQLPVEEAETIHFDALGRSRNASPPNDCGRLYRGTGRNDLRCSAGS
jgi:hypothetical protein